MKTILLYGHLGKKFGRVHHYDVRSPAEAVRALCATLKGFTRAVVDGCERYRVLVGGTDARTEKTLGYSSSDAQTIRIVPVVSGSKSGGVLQTIIGVVLVVVGYYTGYTPVSNVGWALIIGGVAQMIFAPPRPKSVDRPDNQASYAFDGAVNTAAQGNAVPVCYGKLLVGSQVVSAGISTDQI